MERLRPRLTFAAFFAASVLGLELPAVGQSPPTTSASASVPAQSAPTTTPPPATTTSTSVALLEDLLDRVLPTTTTTAAPVTTVPEQAAPLPPPAPPAGPPTTADPAASCASSGVVGQVSAAPRSGPRDTGPLIEVLGRLSTAGLGTEDLVVRGMGRFPVGGLATYTDDWGAARLTPCPHPHRGTDIFASRGTPVRAPEDGVLYVAEEEVGGKIAGITAADGTYYYLAHLEGFRRDLVGGSQVRRGEVVGFVGTSGNAASGSPHTHFQIHPGGGAPVNPKPLLDAWLDEALTNAPRLTVPTASQAPRPLALLAVMRRFDGVGQTTSETDTAGDEWHRATALAEAILRPLTPAPMHRT